MKRQTSLFVTIPVVILLVVGCGGSSSSSSSEDTSFRTGTQGIELSLPSNSPTRFIENGGEEEMILEVHNLGAYTEPDEAFAIARIWAGGYDENLLIVSHEEGEFLPENPMALSVRANPELEGKSSYNLRGGRKPFILTIEPLKLPEGISTYSPTIKFAAAYYYKTIASAPICFDPRPKSTADRQRTCAFTHSLDLDSQGAPVAVTRIEQDITGGEKGKALYRIYIENKGSGKVLTYTDDGASARKRPFTQGYKLSDLDKVRFDELKIGINAAKKDKCRPKVGETVKLIDGKGVIFCEFDKNTLGFQALETTISVGFRYGYTHTISHQITIESESTI